MFEQNVMTRLARCGKKKSNMDAVRKAMHSIPTDGKDDDENQPVRTLSTHECKAEVQEYSRRSGCCTSKAGCCRQGSVHREAVVDNEQKDVV